MSVAVPSFQRAWVQQDRRPPSEWATGTVWTPNMARGSRFDPLVTPWAIEPMDFPHTHLVREQIVMWPTGAGKSNFVDVRASHGASEREGDMLLAVQGNAEAKRYVEKRLLPCFRQIDKISEQLARMDRHAVKKGEIGLPGKTIIWGGVNETNAQAHSVREVIIDEAWMADHGLLEQFRARLHNRWNRIFAALGQGGMEQTLIERQMVDTEWQAAWAQTDQREWCFACPQCGEVQRYRLHGLLYDRPASDHGDFDEGGLMESARYQCIGASRDPRTCDAIFPDKVNVRRDLAKTGRYVPQRVNFRPYHHGWHMNALGIWYEPFGELALQHAKAHRARKRGDVEPIKLFRQKRMAENYRQQEAVAQTALTFGDYELKDYANGELWPGEAVRIMAIDIQLDHFWATVQAFKADGSARLLYANKISTESGLRELQTRMKVQPLELARPRPSWVFVDCGFDRELAFTMGGKYGWWAVRGEGTKGKMAYPHSVQVGRQRRNVLKYYSEIRTIQAASGFRCQMFSWLNLPIKRILEKMRGGYREPFEFPKDLPQDIQDQLFSEIERDGEFVPIVKGRPNHIWDALCMSTVGAIIAGRLPDKPEPAEPASAEPAAHRPLVA